MAETFDPNNMDDEQAPYQQEPLEVEADDAPRRAASARFVVDSNVGSQAALRDAMDPANQSLADALRLSYRVLQLVILVLVVLFLASGFQTIGEGQTGVHTVWGKIVPVGGELELSPGPKFSLYPYPIGEFITISAENLSVDLGNKFMPDSRNKTHEELVASATDIRSLNPGRDGSLLTRDGDLAHMQLSARYEIDNAVDFLSQISDSEPRRNAREIVRLALQRAAIQVVASLSLQELTDNALIEDTNRRIQNTAQAVLDELGCGIRIVQVSGRGMPPVSIERTLGDLQRTMVASQRKVEEARKEADKILNEVAGSGHVILTDLIRRYEDALDRGDMEASERLLADINATMESDEVTGDVVDIIQYAKAYQSLIDRTLGNELRLFRSLRKAFERNPNLVVKQQWLEAYSHVMSREDVEVIQVPSLLASMRLSITGSALVQEIRQKKSIAERRLKSQMEAFDPTMPPILRGSQMFIDQPGRQLEVNREGKLVPVGTAD